MVDSDQIQWQNLSFLLLVPLKRNRGELGDFWNDRLYAKEDGELNGVP